MKTVICILKWLGIVLASNLILIIAATLILDLVFSHQLQQVMQTLKAEGRALTVDEIRPAPVPDELNAALVLHKAAQYFPPFYTNTPEDFLRVKYNLFSFASPVAPIKALCDLISSNQWTIDITLWPVAQREAVPPLMKSPEMQTFYNLLAEAAQKTGCNFGLNYDDGPLVSLPNIPKIRKMFRMLSVKATLAAQNGDANEAFNTILIGFKLANLLKHEPELLNLNVRNAGDELMTDCLERLSNDVDIPADKAREIITELARHTDAAPWIRAMDVERVCMGLWYYNQSSTNLYEAWPRTGPLGADLPPLSPMEAWRWKYLVTPLVRPWLKKDISVYLVLLSQVQDYYKAPYFQVAMTIREKPIYDQIPRCCYIITRMLLSNMDGLVTKNAKHNAEVEVARVGLGLKIFRQKNGAYPDSLDKLAPEFLDVIPVDPFTGQALVYRKDGEGFVLYSVGSDLKDDNGTPAPRKTRKMPPKSGNFDWEDEKAPQDIVWQSAR